MTAPGVAQRVRRLRERGVLRGFAVIAPEAVRAMPEVQECHHVAGEPLTPEEGMPHADAEPDRRA